VPIPAAGQLRLAVREGIRTLDPYLVTNASEEFVSSLLYDTLVRDDALRGLAPNLAQRWELSADGVNLTFWLNPDARWHDGQPVTADDVLFSYRLATEMQVPGWAAVAALVDRLEAIHPDEVKFTLLTVRADAVRILGTELWIVPAHLWADSNDPLTAPSPENPVGSGPLRFVERGEGDQLILRNTRTHHSADLSMDGLVVEILPNENQGLQALKDGELDALGWDVSPSVARDVVDNADDYEGIQLAQAPGLRTQTLLFNLRKAPYNNRPFRQALAQAIDTDAIVDEVLKGFGDVATAGLFPLSSPWRKAGILPIAFNPQRASEELDRIGVVDRDGDGLRDNPDGSPLLVPIACPDLPDLVRLAEWVAASWEAVGVAVEVEAIAQDLVTPVMMEAAFDILVYSISLQEPEMAYFRFHSSRGSLNNGYVLGLNYGGYSNPEYDELAAASLKELNPEQRQILLHQMQDILASDLPQIPLYHPRVLNLYRDDRFTGWSAEPGLGLLTRATIVDLTVSED
jgi:peptide/nickel transport system substrate-binding protein